MVVCVVVCVWLYYSQTADGTHADGSFTIYNICNVYVYKKHKNTYAEGTDPI